jgi:glycosyltransferase involved in cell wall biosynthesis
MTPSDAIVSVGIPVYNAEATVGRALEAISRQTQSALQIIISDNASTDGTLAVCRRYAAADPRIQVIAQSANIGAPRNFNAVLHAAVAPYFMWAAADDHCDPRFVARNLVELERDSRLVASISRVRFLDAHGTEDELGTRPLTGDVTRNVETYLTRPGPNSRFYGLHRREVLLRSTLPDGFLAWDWAIMARTLTYGGHARVDEVLLSRGAAGESRKLLPVIERYNRGLGRVLPLMDFTSHLLADSRIPKTPRVLLQLSKYNLAYTYAAARARLRA